jgi:HMG (high mobility group) box
MKGPNSDKMRFNPIIIQVPKNAFYFFSAHMRDELKRGEPDVKVMDRVKKCKRIWRSLSSQEQQVWLTKESEDLKRYHRELSLRVNSPRDMYHNVHDRKLYHVWCWSKKEELWPGDPITANDDEFTKNNKRRDMRGRRRAFDLEWMRMSDEEREMYYAENMPRGRPCDPSKVRNKVHKKVYAPKAAELNIVDLPATRDDKP